MEHVHVTVAQQLPALRAHRKTRTLSPSRAQMVPDWSLESQVAVPASRQDELSQPKQRIRAYVERYRESNLISRFNMPISDTSRISESVKWQSKMLRHEFKLTDAQAKAENENEPDQETGQPPPSGDQVTRNSSLYDCRYTETIQNAISSLKNRSQERLRRSQLQSQQSLQANRKFFNGLRPSHSSWDDSHIQKSQRPKYQDFQQNNASAKAPSNLARSVKFEPNSIDNKPTGTTGELQSEESPSDSLFLDTSFILNSQQIIPKFMAKRNQTSSLLGQKPKDSKNLTNNDKNDKPRFVSNPFKYTLNPKHTKSLQQSYVDNSTSTLRASHAEKSQGSWRLPPSRSNQRSTQWSQSIFEARKMHNMNEWQIEMQQDKIGPSIELETGKVQEEGGINPEKIDEAEVDAESKKMKLRKSNSTRDFEKRIPFKNLDQWGKHAVTHVQPGQLSEIKRPTQLKKEVARALKYRFDHAPDHLKQQSKHHDGEDDEAEHGAFNIIAKHINNNVSLFSQQCMKAHEKSTTDEQKQQANRTLDGEWVDKYFEMNTKLMHAKDQKQELFEYVKDIQMKKQKTKMEEQMRQETLRKQIDLKKSRFLVKQEKIKNQYKKQLEEIREDQKEEEHLKVVPLVDQKRKRQPTEPFKLVDTYTYHERNVKYQIITNRLMVLAQGNSEFPDMRQYKHPSVKSNSMFYNPLRVKLRIMPQERAGLIKPGKNSQYYFIKAARLSLRNEFPLAIEALNKGLAKDTTNLLCRFNHGAICFKLGLIIEARNDFQMVSALYKKELPGHFNYGLCLYQLGQYKEAKDALELIIHQIKNKDHQEEDAFHQFAMLKASHENKTKPAETNFDFELIQDTFFLLSACNWKLLNPQQSIQNLQESVYAGAAKEIQAAESEQIKSEPQSGDETYEKDYVQKVANLMESTYNALLGKRFKGWEKIIKEEGIPFDRNKIQAEFRNLSLKELKADLLHSVAAFEPLRCKSARWVGRPEEESTKSPSQRKHYITLCEYNSLRSSKRKSSMNAADFKNINQFVIKKQKDEQHQQTANIHKQKFIEKQLLLTKFEEQMYHELREKQIAVIDNGFFDIRFYKAYASLLQPIHREIANIKDDLEEKLKSDHKQLQTPRSSESQRITKNGQAATKANARKTQNETHIDDDDLTPNEREHIAKRQELQKDLQATQEDDVLEMTLAQILQQLGFMTTTRTQQAANQLKFKHLEGTHFQDHSLASILGDQQQMMKMMEKIKRQNDLLTDELMNQIDCNRQKLESYSLQNQEINRDNATLKEQNEYNLGEKFIKDLKKALNAKSELPEEVMNILQDYNQEREKMRERIKQEQNSSSSQRKRFSCRQLKLIAQEFQYKQGSVRSLQILQQMLSQLKYFSLFQPNQRLLICQEASYLCLPARQMIFKQDDLEDFMYIIVKGRVACEMSSIESGNLPIVIQVLGDGEAFGQLTYTLGRGDEKPRKREYAAVTTEETDVLVLNKLLMHKLQFQTTIMSTIGSKFKKNKKAELQDKMVLKNLHFIKEDQKIKQSFLKQLPQFQKIDNDVLIQQLADRVNKVTYKYGDQIIQENEVPELFYILVYGQCKVIIKNIGERRLLDKHDVFQLKYNKHKNNHSYSFQKQEALFNDYDPDNSPLKQINFMAKSYQNQRIVTDSQGEQIKNNTIQYHDQLVVEAIKPGSTFGGRMLVPWKFYPSYVEKFFGAWAAERKYRKGASAAEIEQSKRSEKDQIHLTKSLFTIVADSANVEIWTIDRQSLMDSMLDAKITEDSQKMLYEDILMCPDADRGRYFEPDIQYIKNLFLKWDTYKQSISMPIFKASQKPDKPVDE